MNTQLDLYVSEQRAKGVPDGTIRQSLKAAGWKDADIANAMKVVVTPTTQTTPWMMYTLYTIVGLGAIVAVWYFVARPYLNKPPEAGGTGGPAPGETNQQQSGQPYGWQPPNSKAGSGTNALSGYLRNINSTRFQIVYKNTSEPSSAGSNLSQMTITWDGPARAWRLDSVDKNGQAGTYLQTGGNTYVCDSKDKQCVGLPGGPQASPLPFFVLPDPNIISVLSSLYARDHQTSVTDKVVAGRSAKCLLFTPTQAGKGTGTWCVDAELGATLYYEQTQNGVHEVLEAQSVDTNVHSEATRPPYPVQTLQIPRM